MDNVLNWVGIKVDWVYKGLTFVLFTWGGWYFAKSGKLKKSDEDSATISVAKEYLQVIDLATSGFKDELSHVRAELKQLTGEYMELRIEVGILRRENDRKDSVIEFQKEKLSTQEKEIIVLRKRILELELDIAS
jgi:hypothetical protein